MQRCVEVERSGTKSARRHFGRVGIGWDQQGFALQSKVLRITASKAQKCSTICIVIHWLRMQCIWSQCLHLFARKCKNAELYTSTVHSLWQQAAQCKARHWSGMFYSDSWSPHPCRLPQVRGQLRAKHKLCSITNCAQIQFGPSTIPFRIRRESNLGSASSSVADTS